jgi:hypothetical protein
MGNAFVNHQYLIVKNVKETLMIFVQNVDLGLKLLVVIVNVFLQIQLVWNAKKMYLYV